MSNIRNKIMDWYRGGTKVVVDLKNKMIDGITVYYTSEINKIIDDPGYVSFHQGDDSFDVSDNKRQDLKNEMNNYI